MQHLQLSIQTGKRLKFSFLLPVFLFVYSSLFSQSPVQTIRGKVMDADTELALSGATLIIPDSNPLIGTTSDDDGNFRLENLPLGYYKLKVSLVGYETVTLSQLLLESGKELVLDIHLSEATETLNEVVLIGKRVERESLGPVSVSTLTQEEVIRFPGTFYDPSRLVMTFAGVASTDDQANNIAIRGNSPNSLAWRLEGLEIVNPNHLSNAGTFSDRPSQNGGGVNILSAQLLGTSHFLSGAFPAQYGNALSGVMDMRLRPGNNEQYEFTGQAGLIGIDVAAEGPIFKKGGASFLVNYRYSFIGLLTNLGVQVSDEDITFQDLSFNLNLPTARAGRFTIFGMGGKSDNIFETSRDSSEWEFQKDRFDIFYQNDMGALGFTHSIPLSANTSWNSAFVLSGRRTLREANRLDEILEPFEYSFDQIIERKAAFSTKINHKFNARNRLNAGVYLTQLEQELFSVDREVEINFDDFAQSVLVQPFVNYEQQIMNGRAKVNLGLHYQYLSLNETQSVEPRASLQYFLTKKHSLSFAYGLHGQMQQAQVYFADTPDLQNQFLGFTKAHHFVLSHQNKISPNTTIKTEAYYQSLFDVPISEDPESSFSALNLLENYVSEDLVNEGTGENYGIELTVQQLFSNNTFFLINGSMFESKYTGADGVKRDSRFNSNYIVNFTGGKEFRWTKSEKEKVLGINGRVAYYGGFFETPIDLEASRTSGETVFINDRAFSEKQPDFFKLDLRIYWKNNKPKYSSTVSLDIQNATNRENVAFSYFDELQGEVVVRNQLGLIPILSYRVEF